MDTEYWEIQMLGGLVARQGERTVDRFRTRKGAEMLAALALQPNGRLSREELLDRLWPDDEPEAGRNRLRVELAALRRQFQTGVESSAPLIEADRLTIRLIPQAFRTDTAEFERGLTQAARAEERTEQIRRLVQTVEVYRGDLLPEYDAVWIVAERERFATLHQETLRRLIRRLAQERDFERAIAFARRALQYDVWNEEAHFDLIRLLVAVGQPSAAIRQYEALEQILREHLGAQPTRTIERFIQQIRERLGHAVGARVAAADAPLPVVPVPPLPPAPAAPAELPLRLTRFFGREREQEQVTALLAANRLVTITGPGGNGKTRLAIETAAALLSVFPGGVRFVSLGNMLEAGQLPDALRQSLRLPAQAGAAPLDQVIRALSVSRSLLILDNFEHLVEEGAVLVHTLLAAVPLLTLAVTSRRPLGIDGEREFPLAPLPSPAEETAAEAISAFASVRLFVDRAQAVRPDFHLSARNADSISALCRYLEGIPLAIELAARIRTLTPAQMSDRLVPRLDLLVDSHADKDARHRSLRATIAWSVRMLSPQARRFFARLAVFQGGCDAAAASFVCLSMEQVDGTVDDPAEAAGWSAFDLLERLLSESLLVAEEQHGEMRFSMLETVREFAWEQVPMEEREPLRYRHACSLLRLAEEAEGKLDGSEQSVRLWRLEQERANLTAALTWCAETPTSPLSPSPVEIGLRLVGSLWRFWEMRGSVREGRQFAERLLQCSKPEADPTMLARAFNAAGILAKNESDYPTALAHFEQALTLRRRTGNREGVCTLLSNLGILHSERGDTASSARCYEESLSLARELAIPRRIAATLNNLGALRAGQGEIDAAQIAFEEALELRKKIGDRRAIFSTLINLAAVAHLKGEFEAAMRGQQEALEIARDLEDRFAIAIGSVNLGNSCLALRNFEAAHRSFTEGLQLHTAFGSRFGQAYALEGLAAHAAHIGSFTRAGLLKGASAALRQSLSAAQSPSEREQFEAAFLCCAADASFLKGLETGQSLSLDAAVSLALSSFS